MAQKEVLRFFAILLCLAGVLGMVHFFSFGSVTGASVQGAANALVLSDVAATHDWSFVSISFLVQSPRDRVQVAYSVDNGGESIRTEQDTLIVEPGVVQRHGFRISVPEEALDDFFVTISVADGNSFSYERVRVSRGAPIAAAERRNSRSFFSLLGIALVVCFVAVYTASYRAHQRRVRSFAHHARRSLAFRSRTKEFGDFIVKDVNHSPP